MAVKASVTITISKYRDTDSITRYYKLQASTAAAPAVPTTLTPSGWSTSEPTYTSGSTNTLYYTDCVVFSDGTFQYTDDGNGKAVKSSSYEAAKNAYNKAINAQNVANTTQENLNNLQIGGRNILRKTKTFSNEGVSNTATGYLRGKGTITTTQNIDDFTVITCTPSSAAILGEWLINGCKNGESYTLSFWVKGSGKPRCYFDGPSGYIGCEKVTTQNGTGNSSDGNSDSGAGGVPVSNSEWQRVWVTWKLKDTGGTTDQKYVLIRNDNKVEVYIAGAKFERGDKPTDWTPAPEDLDENIETVSAYAQNVANELLTTKGQLTAATTRIDSLQGIIENFVKDDNGMVTVTQTGSGMQIDMTQATNRINQLLTAIQDAVTEGEASQLRTELLAAIQAVQSRTAYINATQDAQGRPVITLGATDSPFKVEITNEAINFIQNGQIIAYANGQKFYNLRTVVQQDVQIGIGPGFIWKTRDSGNMGLTWVPAQS